MKTQKQNQRRDQILDVAVELLAENGYRNASMLEVARRASASKETLYAWFNNKQGLYEAVIRRNAKLVQAVLQGQLQDDLPPSVALQAFGEALLTLLLGEESIAINRAAVSEAKTDPTLAQVLRKTGREATLPLFVALLEHYHAERLLQIKDTRLAAEQYLGLLLTDLQMCRLLGVGKKPGKMFIKHRAEDATDAFLRLYGATA